MSVLHLMRHGQASFGQANYDRLSELGHRQSAITGRHLARAGIVPDAVYSGDMARLRATAQSALAAFDSPPPLKMMPEFNEYDSGPIIEALLPAMREEIPGVREAEPGMFQDRRSFQTIYEAAMRRWISGCYPVGPAETWAAFLDRVSRGIDTVRAENGRGKSVLVFTSGGPISAVMRLALGLDDERALMLTWVIKNASLSSFFYNDADLSLSQFNSSAHLDALGEKGLITYR